MRTALLYIITGILILSGLGLMKYAFRKQSPQEKLQGKHQLKMEGRGGRIHHFYLGCFLVVCGILFLIKFK